MRRSTKMVMKIIHCIRLLKKDGRPVDQCHVQNMMKDHGWMHEGDDITCYVNTGVHLGAVVREPCGLRVPRQLTELLANCPENVKCSCKISKLPVWRWVEKHKPGCKCSTKLISKDHSLQQCKDRRSQLRGILIRILASKRRLTCEIPNTNVSTSCRENRVTSCSVDNVRNVSSRESKNKCKKCRKI